MGKQRQTRFWFCPQNYGWGMRRSEYIFADWIWGIWQEDEKSPQILKNVNWLETHSNLQFDIVYEDPQFNYARQVLNGDLLEQHPALTQLCRHNVLNYLVYGLDFCVINHFQILQALRMVFCRECFHAVAGNNDLVAPEKSVRRRMPNTHVRMQPAQNHGFCAFTLVETAQKRI